VEAALFPRVELSITDVEIERGRAQRVARRPADTGSLRDDNEKRRLRAGVAVADRSVPNEQRRVRTCIAPTGRSRPNALNCHAASTAVNSKITCLPDSIILELRDAFNVQNATSTGIFIPTAVPVEALELLLQHYKVDGKFDVDQEDELLYLLDDDVRIKYKADYYSPDATWTEHGDRDGLGSDMTVPILHQYEIMYNNGTAYFVYRVSEKPDVVSKYYNSSYNSDEYETSIIVHDTRTKKIPYDFSIKMYGDTLPETVRDITTGRDYVYKNPKAMRMIKELVQSGTRRIGIVFNFLRHAHAIFIDLDQNYFFYFESQGSKIHQIAKDLIADIAKYFSSTGAESTFYSNAEKMEHQLGPTECVMYCLFFLITMGDPTIPLADKLQLFIKKRIPDDAIEAMRYKYTNPSSSRGVLVGDPW
jgi:hypothetical protein